MYIITFSLKVYAEAASSMGERQWVIDGNAWMSNFAISFFRRNGARRHYLSTLQQKYNNNNNNNNNNNKTKDEWDSLGNNLVRDLMMSNNNDNNINNYKKIKLLDVGSCYNPISKSVNADAFDVTAIDLYPMDDSVYKSDFLALTVTDPNTLPNYSKDVDSSSTILSSLPSSSFDCITMSLVLNYLPTPLKRLEMIRKARQLLVNPEYNNNPHHAGILLILEKESIFSNDSYNDSNHSLLESWKEGICNEGFELLRYRRLLTKDSRKAHAFAFKATANMKRKPGAAADGLWISQDYIVDKNTQNISTNANTNNNNNNNNNNNDNDNDNDKKNITKKQQYPIAVIGGGLAGAAIARSLHQRGIPVTVYEKDSGFSARKQGYALTMVLSLSLLYSF